MIGRRGSMALVVGMLLGCGDDDASKPAPDRIFTFQGVPGAAAPYAIDGTRQIVSGQFTLRGDRTFVDARVYTPIAGGAAQYDTATGRQGAAGAHIFNGSVARIDTSNVNQVGSVEQLTLKTAYTGGATLTMRYTRPLP